MTRTLGALNPQVMAAGAAAQQKIEAQLPAIRQAVQTRHATVTQVDSFYTQRRAQPRLGQAGADPPAQAPDGHRDGDNPRQAVVTPSRGHA
jgi:hypothetical protein